MTLAFAYQNHADDGTITASTHVGTLTPSQLQTVHVAELWRGASNSEWILADLGGLFWLDTIALFGCNLTAEGTARFRVSSVDVTGAAGDLYDSGVISDLADPEYGNVVRLLPAQVRGRFVRLDLADTSVAALQAGRLFVGPRAELTYGASPGLERGHTDLSTVDLSKGGQSYVDRRTSLRTMTIPLNAIVEQDRWGIIEQIERVVGRKDDLLAILNTASTTLSRDVLWGRQSDDTPTVQPHSVGVFSKTLKLSQRL
jgi:hypothetical protein